ncbi:MFS transporter [Cohnella nanjingensis]|uniref:MFS transporter n=1 Tax=Cohnella nanjingensis TaxID=1387779 RepID=A0A7X0VF77_9BACL|nr:MFS transporter [Cohnella nanjingensis]MBB6671531.1 MFS transporter [Cohnella nanjingensis]
MNQDRPSKDASGEASNGDASGASASGSVPGGASSGSVPGGAAKNTASDAPANGAAPGSPAADTGSADKLVRLLCFILLFSVMNVTMFNIALPDISRAFDLIPSEAGWVVTGYSIIYAIGSLTYGKLADMYPLRKLLTVGLLLFAAGSILGFASQNYPMMLAARFVQSAGASSIPALVMIIPIRLYAPERRGRVLGVIASAIAFASGVGPIVGGFVSDWLDWRYLFLISVGTLATLPFLRRWLPAEDVRPGRFDFVGAALLAGAMATAMLGITRWNGWLLLTGLVLLALFIVRIRMAAHPFVQPAVFRSGGFRAGLASGFLTFGAAFAVTFLTPTMLSHLNHASTADIGLIMFPAAMGAAILGRYGGKLADSKGSVLLIVSALCLLAIGQLALSTFSGHAVWIIALCLIFGNVGVSFFQASMTKLIASTLPREQTGVGMGVVTLSNFMSGAVTGAIVSKIVDHTGAGAPLNPIAKSGEAALFSNIYLFLAIITLITLAIVYAAFGRRQRAQAVTETVKSRA